VDQTINPNLFPGGSGVGPLVPLFPGVRSDVWVQSVNFGLEFVY
jgi:hypothetical protein